MMDQKTQFELFKKPGTVILTPNRRLSATLHKIYQQQQIDCQQKSWQTPDILPITTWIERLWHDYISKVFAQHPLLLNSSQEQFLWEKILLNSNNKPLLRVVETAELAKSAWSLLKQWQVKCDPALFKTTEDYAALYLWASDYQTICREKNYVDIASLPDYITTKIKTREIIPPAYLITTGFTEISPQLKNLLTVCEEAGSKVNTLSLAKPQSDSSRMRLPDPEHEIITMANWAKSLHEKDPTATIGCVIPSLDKMRDRVQQLFAEIFAEKHNLAPDRECCPFNISAGKSLLQYPIIKTALQLLSLLKKVIPVENFSYLLASPFLGAAEVERIKRANFDKLLRQKNVKDIDLNKLLLLERQDDVLHLEKNVPYLAERIKNAVSLMDGSKKTLSYYEWGVLFNQFLTNLGWPGERSLISEEYQTVENWLKLFGEFQSLDQIAGPVSFYQAIQALQKITQNRTFQPKTPEAPIQVLGILEAAALPFDYLWIAGMDDASWPPQPKPNPFIPKRLQRELAMPHATAERELIYCYLLTNQFKKSANQVIFSHAEKKDELEVQVSSLIRNLPIITPETLQLKLHQTVSERVFHSKMLEKMVDEIGPPLSADEKIRGGMSIIKQQAMCPFKAFAEWRLHAKELENAVPGLRAKDRGSLLHMTLEFLWDELKDHKTLVDMPEQILNELIDTAIDKALTAFPHAHSEQKKYIALEKERMHHLLQDWLNLEKKRTPFKVISREKNAQLTLKQLNLSLRIDRIDELSDGGRLIIDYKAGKNSNINDWFSERPIEPQLPLYSLLDPANTMGITFAQVTPGESCFKGISRDDIEIKGIKAVAHVKQASSWQEQLTKWNDVLTKLSDDFCHGVATVDPKEQHETCTWCALKPLCRIYEE